MRERERDRERKREREVWERERYYRLPTLLVTESSITAYLLYLWQEYSCNTSSFSWSCCGSII